MNTRWVWITLSALAILGALGVGAAAGAALVLFGRDARPALAALPVLQGEVADGGVLVAGVEANSPAGQAGVQRGDILVELDGQALKTNADLFSGLAGKKPGDVIEITALHGDERRTFTITVGDRKGSAFLGIRPCWDGEIGAWMEIEAHPGAMISEVTVGGPADQAGLKVGDVILSVDGQKPGTDSDLGEIIQGYKPGDVVTLEVRRSGESEPVNIEVTLGENPEEASVAYLGVGYARLPGIFQQNGEETPFNPFGGHWDDNFPGMPAAPLDRQFFGQRMPALPEGVEQAILVGTVAEGSPAQQAGLKPGDLITAIDGEAVGDPKQVITKIQDRKPGETISLTVYRQDTEEPMTLVATLGEHPEEAGVSYLGITISGYMRVQSSDEKAPGGGPVQPFFPDEQFFPDLPRPDKPGGELAPNPEI